MFVWCLTSDLFAMGVPASSPKTTDNLALRVFDTHKSLYLAKVLVLIEVNQNVELYTSKRPTYPTGCSVSLSLCPLSSVSLFCQPHLNALPSRGHRAEVGAAKLGVSCVFPLWQPTLAAQELSWGLPGLVGATRLHLSFPPGSGTWDCLWRRRVGGFTDIVLGQSG